MAVSVWDDAVQAARRLNAAEQWRRELAEAVCGASNAVFAVVCTCPPGLFLEAASTAVPSGYDQVVMQIFQDFLPKVERAHDGSEVVERMGRGAYAPLELARDKSLATRFRREILEPTGIEGLINSFIISSQGEILGWIAIGTAQSSKEAMLAHGAALGEVADAAAMMLESALKLASAVGVVARPPRADALSKLTAREREVARLVAVGFADANIGARLGMSEQTVGTHLRRVYAKLGVHSRGELAGALGALWTGRIPNSEPA